MLLRNHKKVYKKKKSEDISSDYDRAAASPVKVK